MVKYVSILQHFKVALHKEGHDMSKWQMCFVLSRKIVV